MEYIVKSSYDPTYFEVGGLQLLVFRAAELVDAQKSAHNNEIDECPYYIKSVDTSLGILHLCKCHGKN